MSDERLLLIEPFYTGSHKRWVDGVVKVHQGEIHTLTLPGRHWKWRMHGAAIDLAEEFMKLDCRPDRILASDMLDLCAFLGLVRNKATGIPVDLYFHENQITYPWSPSDKDVKEGRDVRYGFINYTSALAADRLLFNSSYHMSSFLGALPGFLSQFPDNHGQRHVDAIMSKAEVSYMKLDLNQEINLAKSEDETPVLLWNHRWEYDKNPDEFFEALFQLKEEKISFKLIVTGESYRSIPPIFIKAKEILSEEIVHWGFAESRKEYTHLIGQSTLLPVTSHQDFFGISIIEAMAGGVCPILPHRLAYPELISGEKYFYEGDGFYIALKEAVQSNYSLPTIERQTVHRRFGI